MNGNDWRRFEDEFAIRIAEKNRGKKSVASIMPSKSLLTSFGMRAGTRLGFESEQKVVKAIPDFPTY